MPERDRRSPRQSSKTSPWAAAVRTAGRHGVVTREALRQAGLTDREIDYRAAAGFMRRRHRGVYVLGAGELTPEAEILAGVEAIGPDAVASHRAAAWLWGLVKEPARGIDVTVARRVRGRDGIIVHRVGELPASDTSRRKGIPVTSVPRTLLDLAAELPRPELTRLVNEALVQRRTSVPSLDARVTTASGRPGARRMRQVLATATPTRSGLEDRLVEVLATANLPRPLTNTRVAGLEVDVLFPDAGLVIEADGAPYHDNPLAQARDRERDARLTAAGLRVVRVHGLPSPPPWTSSTAAVR